MAADARAIAQTPHYTPEQSSAFHRGVGAAGRSPRRANEFAATTTRSPPARTGTPVPIRIARLFS
jgi:hypothetical protein